MTTDEHVTALVPRAADPARGGAEAAQQTIAAQAAAGVSLDRMTHHHADTAAWLFSEATTPDGERFAQGYAAAADSLIAELREAEHPLPQPGAPHPDRALAAKGWQVSPHGAGVYIRRQADAQRDTERGGGLAMDPDDYPDLFEDPHPHLADTSLGERPHGQAHCDRDGQPHLGPCTDPGRQADREIEAG